MGGKKRNQHIQKKKRERELKRKKLKRSTVTIKNRQKSQSMNRIKDNFKYIPLLALEPEILNIVPEKSAEVIKTAGVDDVERINCFYDDYIHDSILTALDAMEDRYKKENDKTALINVTAVKYFMSEQKYPGIMNQIVIVKYFMIAEPDTELNADNVVAFIEAFESKHAERIEKLQNDSADEGEIPDTPSDDAADIEAYQPAQPEAIDAFTTFIAEKYSTDGDVRLAELGENFEVFYTDYLVEEKNISELSRVKPTHITFFYNYYFPEKLNPTDEDKKSMAKTLRYFSEMLLDKGVITPDDVREIGEKLSIPAS